MSATRTDPITGHTGLVVDPGDKPFPGQRARILPAGTQPCPFCAGYGEMSDVIEAVWGPGGWSAVARANRWPVLDQRAPVAGPEAVAQAGLGGAAELLVLAARHATSFEELEPAEAVAAVELMRRRLAAQEAAGWACSLAVMNCGAQAGSSQPHTHAHVLATDVVVPIVAAEAERLRGPGCGACAEIASAGPGGLEVGCRGGLAAWVPAAPLLDGEVRIAPVGHDREMGAGDVEDLAVLLGGVLRAQSDLRGEQAYNLVLHTAPAGTEFHWHLHVLPRPGADSCFSLSTGYVSGYRPRPDLLASQLAALLQT